MYTKLFWKDAGERAVATMAQFLLVLGGADGAGFLNMDWTHLVALTVAGGVASVLKSIVAASAAKTDTASFTVDTKPLV